MKQIDSCQREGAGDWMKEGERIIQRICMQDPWTGTKVCVVERSSKW